MRFYLMILFCFLARTGYSQIIRPTNIFYRTIGNKIEIFYDLPKSHDTVDVNIYFRKKSDPGLRYRLKQVHGSIGIGRFSGKKRKAVWDYKKEPPYLFTGSGFYYEIKAEVIHRIQQDLGY